jgi:hypothetical protein
MMMARDSKSETPGLSPQTIALLQDALGRCLERDADLESVQPALRAVAREARERKIFAEHLLITLKDVWYALPQIRQTENEEQQRLLQRLVTLCIREYYGAGPD